jgi:hypothetical protein
MGGTVGEVRGRSKAEVYYQYLELVERTGDTFQECHPDPKGKRECKQHIVQDPDTGDWILYYHLHT